MDNVQHVYYSLYSVYLQQAHLFIKATHNVHILHGLARCAFDEIVNCRKNDDAVFCYLRGNIAKLVKITSFVLGISLPSLIRTKGSLP